MSCLQSFALIVDIIYLTETECFYSICVFFVFAPNRQQSILSDEEAREVEQLLLKEKEPSASSQEPPKPVIENRTVVSSYGPPAPQSILKRRLSRDTNSGDADTRALKAEKEEESLNSIASSNHTSIVDTSVHSTSNNSADDSVSSGGPKASSRSRSASVQGSSASLSGSDINDPDQYYIPEYPPVSPKEVYTEGGIHYFHDGNFWMEIPGIAESCDDDDDDLDYPVFVKKNMKIRFNPGPMQVFSTYSVNDYDRRNEDVDPVAASAEYELEKRVEKMHVFPVELMKGSEGLGLSIIGE